MSDPAVAPATDPHAGQETLEGGAPLAAARAAVILIHGRGSTALNILRLKDAIDPGDVAFLAPQAAGNTWYPYPFTAPLRMNEPYLGSALKRIDDLVSRIEADGVPAARILIAGFSQGACLSLEYVARTERRLGGVAALSGGLIGPPDLAREPRAGAMAGLPVFIGCGDLDAHIGLDAIERSAVFFEAAGADVDLRIYQGMPHMIVQDELDAVQAMLAGIAAAGTRE